MHPVLEIKGKDNWKYLNNYNYFYGTNLPESFG